MREEGTAIPKGKGWSLTFPPPTSILRLCRSQCSVYFIWHVCMFSIRYVFLVMNFSNEERARRRRLLPASPSLEEKGATWPPAARTIPRPGQVLMPAREHN